MTPGVAAHALLVTMLADREAELLERVAVLERECEIGRQVVSVLLEGLFLCQLAKTWPARVRQEGR